MSPHHRYARMHVSEDPENPYSPTLKSGQMRSLFALRDDVAFYKNSDLHFQQAVDRMRGLLSSRGLKGWVTLVESLREKDDRDNGIGKTTRALGLVRVV